MFINLIAKLRCNRGEVSLADSKVTDKPGAGDTSSQDQKDQADKLEGLISDIDLSDVPEERRGEVKKYLAQKVKLYDAGFRAKTEEFSKDKKEFETQKQSLREITLLKDEIEGNPALKTKVTKVINDFRAGIVSDDTSKTDKATKTLDRLIDQSADAETKEGLRQMRQIVQEETSGYGDLKENYKKLEDKLQILETATMSGQTERVEVKLGLLEDKFGKEIVDKYKADIKTAAIKFPGQDINKLFYHYANEDDIKTALLHEVENTKKLEDKRKEDGSGSGGEGVPKSYELKKDKHGRTDIKNLVGQIFNKNR